MAPVLYDVETIALDGTRFIQPRRFLGLLVGHRLDPVCLTIAKDARQSSLPVFVVYPSFEEEEAGRSIIDRLHPSLLDSGAIGHIVVAPDLLPSWLFHHKAALINRESTAEWIESVYVTIAHNASTPESH